MPTNELNLGILAHVDAGKTTLTERLLYEAGVIAAPGSVDAGTTQTDSLALERRRGITIKAAVASFALGDVHVNLVDTPGHPDFIAEVERVLGVLDGAVLVVSAVEGVQPQTRILMRALRRLGIPTLVFVNKIDRAGAGYARVLDALDQRLGMATVAMGTVDELGTRSARFTPWGAADAAFATNLTERLADASDAMLATYVEQGDVSYARLRAELVAQTARGAVHPVFFGSAITGAGVEPLMSGITELLPRAAGEPDGPVSGLIFKIDRSASREKIAYVRLFSGTIHTRDRLQFRGDNEGKVTAIAVFEGGHAVPRPSVAAGAVAKLSGLRAARIGDRLGAGGADATSGQFEPPTLEAVVVAGCHEGKERLHTALLQLAEQDPLINVRQDAREDQLSISLYGEVQKEVIEATLADDFGLDVTFQEATPIYIERPAGVGEAVEVLNAGSNPFFATVGFRVAAADAGSGVAFRLEVEHELVPLYVYKTIDSFAAHMDQYVRGALGEGLFGWEVTDCVVTMNRCLYSLADGPPSRRGPLSTAADFRKLTPMVLMQALERATTVVCEPVLRVRVEIPTVATGAVLSALTRLGAGAQTSTTRGELTTVAGAMPAARVQDLRRTMPGLTGGEGVVETEFGGYQPVRGSPPSRRRTTPNPLDRDEYLRHLRAVPA